MKRREVKKKKEIERELAREAVPKAGVGGDAK